MAGLHPLSPLLVVATGTHLPLVPALIVVAVVVGLKLLLSRRKRH
jgi:hypothetical protein